MYRHTRIIGGMCLLAWAAAAHAQVTEGTIAPLPFSPPAESAPAAPLAANPQDDAGMLTTHDTAKPAAAAPFEKPASPIGAVSDGKPASYQPKIPFGKADYSTKPIPEGPRSVVAVPIVDVDAVESSEPAPATPMSPETNPAEENPEDPTELTSPIFVEDAGPLGPRKIVLRALNKVTAQSATLNLKPNEMVRFGQLEITAVTCQTSAPNSQTDYAALLDISENPVGAPKPKQLFRGWMYASSPSIAALEHPVYDVTMVNCDIMPSGAKVEPKEAKKTEAKPKN